ncbi:uncharacterized protein EDB91DRAFT_1089238 [Suillus paluster]|uniref:uncharacterized protein n=1 Tax=Suillus paluster TaxID=48578 RepID=UPI001B860B5E|nr:uncharacterized protein EDB91DRAFT_1089238 [Suillus paluster]KAG1719622.1 hypothetical protein EDB91DRAFT_1089238 [Suillus paluster]
MHAPQSNPEDHSMSAPETPSCPYSPNEEEKAILAHLALAEKNRSTMHNQFASPPHNPKEDWESKNFPIGFLVHNISEETKDLILSTRICCCTDVWVANENRAVINDLISMSEIKDEEKVYAATWSFIRSIRIELLDFKVTGGLSVPCFNVLAVSPICDAKAWTDLRSFLHTLDYPTGLDGCGTAIGMTACPICHSIAHPRGLCPFPETPLWNGPKIGAKSSIPTRNPRPKGQESSDVSNQHGASQTTEAYLGSDESCREAEVLVKYLDCQQLQYNPPPPPPVFLLVLVLASPSSEGVSFLTPKILSRTSMGSSEA